MTTARRPNLGSRVLHRVISTLDRCAPGTNAVTFVSFPDLDDSVVSMLRSPFRRQDVAVRVLADDVADAMIRARALGLDVDVVARKSIRGLWIYVRSRVCFSTHGVWGSRPRARSKSNITTWHGELNKLAGLFDGEAAKHFERVYVSNNLSMASKAAQFGIRPSSILVTGQPRTTLFQSGGGSRVPAGRYWVWAPTYRESMVGLRRRDGDASVFEQFVAASLELLQPVLEQHEIDLWLRFHPATRLTGTGEGRVLDASNKALEAHGLTFYELLGGATGLITDFSSLWLDFLQLDRPMVCAAPDFDAYLDGRPMILTPYVRWFPGPLVTTPEDLTEHLTSVTTDGDPGAVRRSALRSQLCPPVSEPADERVWRDIGSILKQG